MAAANGGKDAASFSSSAFEWVPPGRLEVIDSFAARLRFDVVTTGTAWLSKYDIKSTVTTVAKAEPLYSDLKIGRDGATMTVGYAALDPVTKLASLDGRQVLISESQVTISVQRVRHEAPEAAARPWKEHYFGGDADASPAVLEELFQRADPRPDTLVVANLPLKWLGDDVSAYATRAANAEALREPMERLVGGPVAAVEAVVPDALTMRMVVYVRCRRLADVERGFARLYGKALRYVPSDMTAAAEVGVDRTSFFAPAACAARAQAEEQEMAARRQRQGQRERLGRERGELRAWLEEVKEKVGTEAEEERSQDLVRMMQEQLELMGELLDEAEGRDGEAKHPGHEGVEALRALMEIHERVQETKRAIEGTRAHMAEDRQERRRLQEVRDVRVAKAKQLKALDERWRGVLEAAAEGVKGTALCAGQMEATQRALARARDLVLREAARIVNAQEYAEALHESLVTAEKRAGLATRALHLQAQANAGQTGLAALEAEMRAVREDMGVPSSSTTEETEEDEGEEGEGGNLREVAFLKPFLASAAMQRSLAAAKAAVRKLGEVRSGGGGDGATKGGEEKGDGAVEALARVVKELEAHYTKTLRPAWDKHSPLLPWQRRLQAALQAHGGLILETPVLVGALRSARAALRRAVRERGTATPEEFHGLLCGLQAAVEGVDDGVVQEKRRRREAEEARRREAAEAAKREREKEAAAREEARRQKRARARLERLTRRRAFLEEGLRLERAREAWRRVAADGMRGEGEEMEGAVEEEEEVVVVVTSVKGSQAVAMPPRPVNDTERWPVAGMKVGPPLNLAMRCWQNDLSRSHWAGELGTSSNGGTVAEEEGVMGNGEGKAPQRRRLRSEVFGASLPAAMTTTKQKQKRPRVLVVDTSAAMSELLQQQLSPSSLAPSTTNGAALFPGMNGKGGKEKNKNKKKKKNKGSRKRRRNGGGGGGGGSGEGLPSAKRRSSVVAVM